MAVSSRQNVKRQYIRVPHLPNGQLWPSRKARPQPRSYQARTTCTSIDSIDDSTAQSTTKQVEPPRWSGRSLLVLGHVTLSVQRGDTPSEVTRRMLNGSTLTSLVQVNSPTPGPTRPTRQWSWLEMH